MAARSNCKLDEIHFQYDSCKIILKLGDLLSDADVEALVIPAPPADERNAQNFALFQSVYNISSDHEKKQIDKLHSGLKPQQAQVLTGDMSSYIFVVPPYLKNAEKASKLLKKTYSSCLELAANKKFRSIAFPTIGCGVIGFETENAVNCICLALENFFTSKNNKKQMDEIQFVIYDVKVYNEFTNLFMDYAIKNKIEFEMKSTSTKDSNPSEMSRTNDRHSASQRQMDKTETTDNRHAIDDTRASGNTRNDSRQATSTLNPDAPEFHVATRNQCQTSRRFYLKDTKRTLIITQGDILKTKVDAIVNVVDETMLNGDEIDKNIRQAAGLELKKACLAYKEIESNIRLPTGRSRVLLSYNLHKTTHYIINTAGPRYKKDSDDQCKKQLASCYQTSLDLANIYDLETISFPAISCDSLGYPLDEAAEVALTTINDHEDHIRKILFVLSDDATYDTWVKKAEELQFISQDDPSANKTSPENPSALKVIDCSRIDDPTAATKSDEKSATKADPSSTPTISKLPPTGGSGRGKIPTNKK